MLVGLKLSHHTHTGKLRSHEHTSYLPLAVLLMVVGCILGVYTVSAAPPGPESGSIGISGTVPAKPPTVAATIDAPTAGSRFAETPVEIAGTCPKDTLVEVFKNDIFAGSTSCSGSGTYSLKVDLLIGQNSIVARVYDALNQAGPDSNAVVIFYDALPEQGGPISSLDFGGSQLLLNTDAVFRGIFPNTDMIVPISVLGGTAPYAVNVQWGDSTNKVIPRGDNVEFTTAHAYKKPGIYQISLQASDAEGRVAFLTVAAIVNGQPDAAASTGVGGTGGNSGINGTLAVAWPVLVASFSAVVSFWLGERREKKILTKHGLLSPQ